MGPSATCVRVGAQQLDHDHHEHSFKGEGKHAWRVAAGSHVQTVVSAVTVSPSPAAVTVSPSPAAVTVSPSPAAVTVSSQGPESLPLPNPSSSTPPSPSSPTPPSPSSSTPPSKLHPPSGVWAAAICPERLDPSHWDVADGGGSVGSAATGFSGISLLSGHTAALRTAVGTEGKHEAINAPMRGARDTDPHSEASR